MKEGEMGTIIWSLIFLSVAVYFIFDYQERNQTTPNNIKNLELIKEAVFEKFIPDTLKQKQKTASHNLMFVKNGSDEYWRALHEMQEVDTFIAHCPPCVYIQELYTKEKEKELNN